VNSAAVGGSNRVRSGGTPSRGNGKERAAEKLEGEFKRGGGVVWRGQGEKGAIRNQEELTLEELLDTMFGENRPGGANVCGWCWWGK